MLSRGGGAVAFQKVVSKVSDLPSPLDAEPGMRIIVRETEEVYGLNATTRMWEAIGTLKKVGGKKPEELAAHVDSEGNPHGTSLQDVLDKGTVVTVSQEIVINGKGPATQLRFMSGNSALRVGPDAGSKDGVLWMNVGSGKKTFLRAVDSNGDDMMVLSTDGIVSGGSATFASYKGLAEFEDEIVANEGVMSASGYDLVLSGDKGVLLKAGGKDAALFTDQGLDLRGSLGVGNLAIGGRVKGSLLPMEAGQTLGDPLAPWAKAAVGDLDVGGQILVQIPSNSKKPSLQVSGAAPAHGTTLTALGELGLGTDAPKARLDVRGAVLVDELLHLDRSGLKCGDWVVSYGDQLLISRKGKTVLKGGDGGVTLAAGAKVDGDLIVTGALQLGGVSGLQSQGLSFKSDGSAAYTAKSHQFSGGLVVDAAKGKDLLALKSAGDTLLSVESDGTLLGSKIGRVDAPWDSAFFERDVNVGDTAYRHGKIVHKGEFTVDAETLVAGPNLRLTGQAKVEVLNTLDFVGHGGKAELALGGPNCGLTFEARHFEMSGINKLAADVVNAKALSVDGDASFCGGAATLSKQGLNLAGALSVGGLAFKKVSETIDLSVDSKTKFELPAGVRIEAVLVKLLTDVGGARFLQVGDAADPDRFAGPSTELKAGSLIRGLNHWGHGRAVQKVKGPIMVSGDAAASGQVMVTVHYVDPAAL